MPPDGWTRPALERVGFEGWHRFGDGRQHLGAIPTSAGGVYVVYRDTAEPPTFLERSPVATWRGDPSVTVAVLAERWIEGVGLVNIGKLGFMDRRARRRAGLPFPHVCFPRPAA